MRRLLCAICVTSIVLTTAIAPYAAAAAAAVLSAGIASTFAWLWWRRATPLAAGLSLSWAGASLIALDAATDLVPLAIGVVPLIGGGLLQLGVIDRAGATRVALFGMAAALAGALALH